jgi:hypothetical protein
MKSIWILGIVLTSLYSNCYSEEEIASAPSSEIAGVGVGVDVNAGGGYYGDDGVYYYYDDAPIIWIGPGLYYGFILAMNMLITAGMVVVMDGTTDVDTTAVGGIEVMVTGVIMVMAAVMSWWWTQRRRQTPLKISL